VVIRHSPVVVEFRGFAVAPQPLVKVAVVVPPLAKALGAAMMAMAKAIKESFQ
jgi:hypothetical protein